MKGSENNVRILGLDRDGNRSVAQVGDGSLFVGFGDSPSADAFQRLRVSNPVTLLDAIHKYDKLDSFWYEDVTGGGTAAHEFDEASVLMTVTSSGDRVIRQSRDYIRYQPGKSQLALLTFNLNPDGLTTGVRKSAGYFDDENGIFIEVTSSGAAIVKRSSTTGSPVETSVAQADWNLNALSDLDLTKTQILVIDLQWLGVGRVRVGFDIDGLIVYVHEFLHANVSSSVYMTTAQLPVRYEIHATGTPSGATTMRQICSAVISEGGVEEQNGIPHSTNSGAPAAISGTKVPLISIRPKATFGGETNRMKTVQRELQVLNTGNGTAEVSVFFEGTLTGASFASVEADSSLEVDTSATAVTGGHLVLSFYVPASNQAAQAQAITLIGNLAMSLDIAGANPTNLTIAVTNHGTVTAAAAMTWQEYQ